MPFRVQVNVNAVSLQGRTYNTGDIVTLSDSDYELLTPRDFLVTLTDLGVVLTGVTPATAAGIAAGLSIALGA